jgi:hypothetical protein
MTTKPANKRQARQPSQPTNDKRQARQPSHAKTKDGKLLKTLDPLVQRATLFV